MSALGSPLGDNRLVTQRRALIRTVDEAGSTVLDELLTRGETAKLLGLSVDGVARLDGTLEPLVTRGGQRLYLMSRVQLARERRDRAAGARDAARAAKATAKAAAP